jgi:hypothetical protein
MMHTAQAAAAAEEGEEAEEEQTERRLWGGAEAAHTGSESWSCCHSDAQLL